VGRCPWQIAAGADAIWTTNCHDGTVTRIDPHRNEVAATIRVGHRPLSVSVGRDAVWVGVAEAG
jgi:YVTN family beta-propeller protein